MVCVSSPGAEVAVDAEATDPVLGGRSLSGAQGRDDSPGAMAAKNPPQQNTEDEEDLDGRAPVTPEADEQAFLINTRIPSHVPVNRRFEWLKQVSPTDAWQILVKYVEDMPVSQSMLSPFRSA